MQLDITIIIIVNCYQRVMLDANPMAVLKATYPVGALLLVAVVDTIREGFPLLCSIYESKRSWQTINGNSVNEEYPASCMPC